MAHFFEHPPPVLHQVRKIIEYGFPDLKFHDMNCGADGRER